MTLVNLGRRARPNADRIGKLAITDGTIPAATNRRMIVGISIEEIAVATMEDLMKTKATMADRRRTGIGISPKVVVAAGLMPGARMMLEIGIRIEAAIEAGIRVVASLKRNRLGISIVTGPATLVLDVETGGLSLLRELTMVVVLDYGEIGRALLPPIQTTEVIGAVEVAVQVGRNGEVSILADKVCRVRVMRVRACSFGCRNDQRAQQVNFKKPCKHALGIARNKRIEVRFIS